VASPQPPSGTDASLWAAGEPPCHWCTAGGESPAAEPVTQPARPGGEDTELAVAVPVEAQASAAPPPTHPPSTHQSPSPAEQPGDVPLNRSDVSHAGGDDQPVEYRGKPFNTWGYPCHILWPATYPNLTAYQRPRIKEMRRYRRATNKAAWNDTKLREQARNEWNAANKAKERSSEVEAEAAYLAACIEVETSAPPPIDPAAAAMCAALVADEAS